MYCIVKSKQSLLKQLINRMAADIEAGAAGILLLSNNVIDKFKADCAMLTFVKEHWS